MASQGRQLLDDPFEILIGRDAQDQDQASILKTGHQRFAQAAGRITIMRPVEDDPGLTAHRLQSSLPLHLLYPLADAVY